MFKVKLEGLGKFKAELETANKSVKAIVDAELQAGAAEFVSGARRDAPIDQGALKGSISYYKDDDFAYSIVAQKFYAPFMEFGTKGKYKPIPGTEAIAAAFKGYKGGDFNDLLRAIVLWVKRKGISGTYSVKTRKRTGSTKNNQRYIEDLEVAYPLALAIIRGGIKPHPFFFKQQEVVWPKMVERIKKALETASKVSVILPGDIKRPKIITI